MATCHKIIILTVQEQELRVCFQVLVPKLEVSKTFSRYLNIIMPNSTSRPNKMLVCYIEDI